VNDRELLTLCQYFRERGHPLRFIEFMDVGIPTIGPRNASCRARTPRPHQRRMAA